MKDITAMALKAGFKEHNGMIYATTINDDCAKELESFAELVRADEREACAKECKFGRSSADIEQAIRARGETTKVSETVWVTPKLRPLAKLAHEQELELAEQPAQTDWEAVSADQAMTIALLKAEQPAQQEHFDHKAVANAALRDAQNRSYQVAKSTQTAQQEPVAFSQFLSDVVTAAGLLSHGKTDKSLAARISEFAFRLRTSPQPAQRKPLTDDEMWKLWNSQGIDEMNQQEAIAFARAIEAAHGIKGDA